MSVHDKRGQFIGACKALVMAIVYDVAVCMSKKCAV